MKNAPIFGRARHVSIIFRLPSQKCANYRQQYKRAKVHLLTFLLSRILSKLPLPTPSTPLAGPANPPATTPTSLTSSTATLIDLDLASLPDVSHEDFENLYYVVVCKIKELYYDLQVRFACGFISLDHILHNRGSDSRTKDTPCTVRSFRNFVLLAWHLLHDGTFRYLMDEAIKNRKIAIINATLLLPPLELITPPHSAKDPVQRLSMDTPVMRCTTRGLQSVENSTVLLDSIVKKYTLGSYEYPVSSPLAPIKRLKTLVEAPETELAVIMENKENQAKDRQSQVRFDNYGNILSALPCVCTKDCDCMLICSKFPDTCVCQYRCNPLGVSPDRLTPHFRLQRPPRLQIRDKSMTIPIPEKSATAMTASGSGSLEWALLTPSKCPGLRAKTNMFQSPSAPLLVGISQEIASPRTPQTVLIDQSKHLSPFDSFEREIQQTPFTSKLMELSSVTNFPLPPTPPPKPNRSSEPVHIRRPTHHGKSCYYDVSYRVPFEENKFFQSSPSLNSSPTRKVRYVSAGGNLPISARPLVEVPFTETKPTDAGFAMPKEQLLGRLPEVSKAKIGKMADSAKQDVMIKRTKSNRTSRFKGRFSRFFDR
jgi:hypothetical protein